MKRRKPTGERQVFEAIWKSRPHVCEVCGAILREPRAHNFAHIIPKSRRPDLRLDPDNIRLLCLPCHTSEHTGGKATSYVGT